MAFGEEAIKSPIISTKEFLEIVDLYAPNKKFITTDQASEITRHFGRGFSKSTLYKLKKYIPQKKMGRSVYYQWTDLYDFLLKKMI